MATDLAALAELAHRHGAWLFVDACQAAGAVPLDVRALDVDFLATSSHKFLCGTRGMGYLYARRELAPSMRPIQAGWMAAREPLTSFYGPGMTLADGASRLDASSAWFPALGDRAALRMLHACGTDAIHARNATLVRLLREQLVERGLAAESPDAPVRSTVVSFAVPDANAVVARLRADGIVVAARAGRVRVSLHAYNTPDEIARVVDGLEVR